MISQSHSRFRCITLISIFSIVSVSDGLAKSSRPPTLPNAIEESADQGNAGANLAEQVSEIANSAVISRAKKEKRISTAVRVAVTAATAYKQKSEDILGLAIGLAEAAARAAPSYAEVIANATSFTPSLARIESAPGQIRTAAYAAAKNPKGKRLTRVAATPARPTAPRKAELEGEYSDDRTIKASPQDESESAPHRRNYAAEATVPDELSSTSNLSPATNATFNVTADLTVTHDDNIYQNNTTKVGDTIVAATPGVAFNFGQNSLAHGSLSYKSAFTHYLDKTSPNVVLGDGAATFGYDSGTVAINGAAKYQERNQSNNDAVVSNQAIYRSNVLGINGSVETHLTAKTSVMTGANYNKTEYKTGGLSGSQDTEIPLKFYFETSPKVSLSTGLSYRRVSPQNGTARGKDMDYNVGARGNFTAKLNGTISADYRTRSVEGNPTEKLWGLNGALNYELTPKTTSSLGISNDFSTGAQGQSLKNSSYHFNVSTDLTPQWQLGANLSYQRVEYGPSVFSVNKVIVNLDRNDRLWSAGVQASYLFRSWLSMTAAYNLRLNHSTLTPAEYTDNLLSLMLSWRY